ncbi:MAG: hypothetical protein ACYTF8_16275 [Planctomycetota bacterium]
MSEKWSRWIDDAVPDEEAEAELLEGHRAERRRQLRSARLYARIDAKRHYALKGASSIAHFGELHGRSAREARMLAAVGRVLKLRPELEEKILCGAISLDAAAALRPICENPDLVREGDDWLAWAAEWSARELDRAVQKRVLEVESGEKIATLTALLTASAWEKFERAKTLLSRKAKENLSHGQTVEALVDYYLNAFDPDRKTPRKRRTPDTEDHPGRTVPEEVKRAIRGRPHGDQCAVPGCDHHLWLNYAHITPHREGGGREPKDLHQLCWQHHLLYDWGILRITGTPDRPIFHLPGGQVLVGFAPVNGSGPNAKETVPP